VTGLEIKKAAEVYIEEFIDDPDAVYFINLALNMLGDMALIYEVVRGEIKNPASGTNCLHGDKRQEGRDGTGRPLF